MCFVANQTNEWCILNFGITFIYKIRNTIQPKNDTSKICDWNQLIQWCPSLYVSVSSTSNSINIQFILLASYLKFKYEIDFHADYRHQFVTHITTHLKAIHTIIFNRNLIALDFIHHIKNNIRVVSYFLICVFGRLTKNNKCLQ